VAHLEWRTYIGVPAAANLEWETYGNRPRDTPMVAEKGGKSTVTDLRW